jgi:hypothetical protein
MKYLLLTGVLALGFAAAAPASAEPGGCLKYGAGGAVAGHFVGRGHAVAGAAAGCAAGMYQRHEARKDMRERANQDQHAYQSQGDVR